MDDKDQRQKLSASLRILRGEHKYTQREFADLIGITRAAYANYEIGKTLPNIFILDRIASAYGITIDTILHNPICNLLGSSGGEQV